MTILYLEALKKLPKRFIHKDTMVKEFVFKEPMVFAVNPNYAPIVYKTLKKRWILLKWKK